MYPLPYIIQRRLNVIAQMCLQLRNCNWKNEKVFVIIYSILVALFSVIKGNMYVYVRDEEYLIQEMLNEINVFNKFHIFLFEYR